MTSSAVIDGVDVDALAAAVRSCPGVDDLDRGPRGNVATYLPGRQLAGVRLASGRVTVQVIGTWGVPVRELAAQIEQAAAPFVGNRMVDIVLAGLTDPTPSQGALTAQDNPSPRTTPNAAAAPTAPPVPTPRPPRVR